PIMAVVVVGEAFLTAFIEVVLDRLTSPQGVNLIRGNSSKTPLLINKWLDDLKDDVYVADDILDHISTKVATTWKKKEYSQHHFHSGGNSDRSDSGADGSGNGVAGAGGYVALTPNQWSDLSGLNSPQCSIDVVVAPRKFGDGRHSSEQFICFVSFFFDLFRL
ncbi:NB-LRR type disease resistance protein Rps1-k-2, partial [Trifolium pratense]